MGRKIWYTKTFAVLAAVDAGLPRFGIEETTDRYGVATYAIREPFNPEVHDHLIAIGYTFIPRPAEWDDGDPENGPGTGGYDEWDEYEGPAEYIAIDRSGHVVHREDRDLEFEAWIDKMNTVECDRFAR